MAKSGDTPRAKGDTPRVKGEASRVKRETPRAKGDAPRAKGHAPRAKRDGRSAQLRGTARERLLDAALAELREHGYAATSLQAIAKRAGLTKGAIYWSFAGKQDLFLALVEERLAAPARALMQITETAPQGLATAPLASQGVAQILREQPDIVLLGFEHWSLAVREKKLRAGYVERQRALRRTLAHALQSRHRTLGVPLDYPAEPLATAIIALAMGLAMEALADPDAVTDQLYGDVLGLIYDGLAARAGKLPS